MRFTVWPICIGVGIGTVFLTSACVTFVPGPEHPSIPTSPARVRPSMPDPSVRPVRPKTTYELCIEKTERFLVEGDTSRVAWAPEERATMMVRDDNSIGVYVEVTDGNDPTSPDVAAACVFGGDMDDPFVRSAGIVGRLMTEDAIEEFLQRWESP